MKANITLCMIRVIYDQQSDHSFLLALEIKGPVTSVCLHKVSEAHEAPLDILHESKLMQGYTDSLYESTLK